jgi:hypothetical protein
MDDTLIDQPESINPAEIVIRQSLTLTQLRPFFLATNNAMSARLTIEP